LIIFNSDDFKDDSNHLCKSSSGYPYHHVTLVTQAWKDGQAYLPIPNMVNIMGRMEIHEGNRCLCGCSDHSDRAKSVILVLLINDETRRLSSSAYLGRKILLDELPQERSYSVKIQGHLDRLLVNELVLHSIQPRLLTISLVAAMM